MPTRNNNKDPYITFLEVIYSKHDGNFRLRSPNAPNSSNLLEYIPL